MRCLGPALVVLLLLLGAEPALACRIPGFQSNSVFDVPPVPPSGAEVFRGRFVTEGRALSEARTGEPVPEAEDFDAVVLFALLERPDAPPLRIYAKALRTNCDRSDYGAGRDVWIVGRPLPDQDGGRVAMMAMQRSGRWIDN